MEIVELHWGAKMLILIVGLILLYYWVIKIILIMSKKHILVMERKNGTAVPIYAKGGGVVDISVLYYGHDYDNNTGEITKKTGKIERDVRIISFIKSFFWIEGLYWLGPTRETRKKTKKWLEYKLKPEGKFAINERTEDQDFIWLKDDVYPVLITNIEIKGMGTVDVILLFYIRIKNPNKTLCVENWLTATLEALVSSSKDQLETLSYEEITGKSEEEEEEYEKDEDEKQETRIALLGETQKVKVANSLFSNLQSIISELLNTYGGETFKIGMPSIELSGPLAKEYQQASILGYKTKKEAQRIQELADARQYEIETIYREIHKWEHGLEIFRNETIQKAGEKGNVVITPMEFKGNILVDTSKSKRENGKEETK